MRVYYFTSCKYGIENLEKRRLKVARILDLNDPFEFIAMKLGSRVARKKLRLFRDKIDSEFGIICFSKSWNQPLMWSHYADAHRGICLGFDVADTSGLKAVEYEAYRPDQNSLGGVSISKTTDKQRMDMGFVKSTHWDYEREHRLIIKLAHAQADRVEVNGKLTTLYFQSFNDQIRLKKVIVGERCEVSRDTLKEKIGADLSEVELIRARLAFNSFSVVKQRNSALW